VASPPSYLKTNDGDTDDPVGNPDPDAKIADAIAAIYKFKPHVILHSYPPSAIAKTFFPLVLNWPRTVPVPYHVDLIGTFIAFPTMNGIIDIARLHSHVFTHGTHVVDRSQNDAFVLKFKSANKDPWQTGTSL
jgi:hypothetical protein